MNPLRLVTALATALAAFAAAPVLHAQPQPIVPPTQAEKVEPSPDSDAADVSMLNAELFYEVLLGEINSADGDRSYDEIEDKTAYYLRRPDGRVVAVKLTVKSLAEAAPDLERFFDIEPAE